MNELRPCSGSKPAFLVKRWVHHTPSGGYDQLAAAIGGIIVGRTGRGNSINRIIRRIWRHCCRTPQGLLDYTDQDWLAEWTIMAKARREKLSIVHSIYGDEQLDVLLRWRGLLPCPLVATFHLPSWRECVRDRFERYQKHLVAGIDSAIVVSRCQQADFQKWLGAERVVYIPHGINTRVFSPGSAPINEQDPKVRLVCVGEHMRDLESLRVVIDECRQRLLPVEFDLVMPPSTYSSFYGCTNVRFHKDIAETELIQLYRQADALVIPVLEATANNAILEAIACGTPVISTNIDGVPDYVDQTCGWLFPKGDVQGVLALIKSACKHRSILRSRREAARAKSMEFDWHRVAGKVTALYEHIAEVAKERPRLRGPK